MTNQVDKLTKLIAMKNTLEKLFTTLMTHRFTYRLRLLIISYSQGIRENSEVY